MGFEDRRYWDSEDRGAGGFRDALRRMFGQGDFFAWAFPLFTASGIRVRIHLLFVLFIAIELIRAAIRTDVMGVAFVALGMACLFTMVLLHEFGHCFACRWVGGEANEILMWPLGGLAYAAPPHDWKASFITTAGGPAVNLLLAPILGAAIFAAGGGWGDLFFNYFAPGRAYAASDLAGSWWTAALWWANYTNLLLFGFNVFLPMFPMDGGRMVQELLWARLGYRRSMAIAVNVGLVAAIAVGIFSITSGETILLGIALFAGMTCYGERKKLEFMEEAGLPGYDFSRGFAGMPGAGRASSREADRKYREALKRQERERREQAEVDRILEKVHRSGLASLTRAEKRTLQRDTERKRRGR